MYVRTVIDDSDYPRNGDCVSWDAAVAEVRGQVTLHGARDSSRLPLLAAHQLLHPEEARETRFTELKKHFFSLLISLS